MAIENQFVLTGVDQVVRKMRALPLNLKKRGLRAAIRKGANIVRDAAIAGARLIDDPQTAENIAKNIAVQFQSRKSKKERGIVLSVGVRGGARQYGATRENRRKQRVGATYKTGGDKSNPGGDTWYWRFIELGTSRQAARPFLRPALENNVERVTQVIVSELNLQIDRLVATNASE